MSNETVTEDPALESGEKELLIRVNKAEDELTVFTEIASVARALLNRSDFTERERRTVDGEIVAVKGTLPIGVLKIQRSEREYGSWSKIVSSHNAEE